MGPAEIEQFPTHLAVDLDVAASTQNQALQAILFLYREVFHYPRVPFSGPSAGPPAWPALTLILEEELTNSELPAGNASPIPRLLNGLSRQPQVQPATSLITSGKRCLLVEMASPP